MFKIANFWRKIVSFYLLSEWNENICSIAALYSSTFCSLFLPFFVLEIFKYKYKVFVRHSASISKFEWFEQLWWHTHKIYRSAQYLPVLTVQESWTSVCNVNHPFLAKKTFNIKSFFKFLLLIFQPKMNLIWSWPIISDVAYFLINKNKRAQNSKRF